MKTSLLTGAVVGMVLALGSPQAFAAGACITKSAEATSGSAESAKWFAIETMVQGISWSLWPGYVANSKVEGYSISNQKFNCKPAAGGTYCVGSATFCKTK
jgi:hypothetical protein